MLWKGVNMRYDLLLLAIGAFLFSIAFTFVRRLMDGVTDIEGIWSRKHPNRIEMIGLVLVIIGFMVSMGIAIFIWIFR